MADLQREALQAALDWLEAKDNCLPVDELIVLLRFLRKALSPPPPVPVVGPPIPSSSELFRSAGRATSGRNAAGEMPLRPNKRLLRVREAAAYLNVSEKCIWNWVYSRRVASYRLSGRCVRISLESLEALADRGRTPVAEEEEEETLRG